MNIETVRRVLLWVHGNQLWNFTDLVFRLHAGTRLDVSVSWQVVSPFSGAI
jgi:hypothetical protein